MENGIDGERRAFLVQALSLGLLTGGIGWDRHAVAELFGRVPEPLPEGRSIFRLVGEAQVNGRPADFDTVIGPSDRIETGPDSELVAVIGQDAFILREESDVELSLGDRVKQTVKLLGGAMLNVFGTREDDVELDIETRYAAAGIRGTGIYTETRPRRSYICNCYGSSEIVAADAPDHRETIVSGYHDDPRWVVEEPIDGQRIIPAPVINHTDLELITLEALVGRTVPFGAPGRAYPRRRRGYPD